ncbi:MAG: amidohydrolase, partial [Oscillibacter sp.]|nr:amidohydrolase [Oscillibacter sp.]
MTGQKAAACGAIGEKEKTILALADGIWSTPELSLQETRSAALLCDALRSEGFSVEEGVCAIPTAFAASFGSGSPRIGILAEYDALSGLSQRGGALEHAPLVPNGNGHGCGHNLLGAGAFAAAVGIKAFLETSGRSGTVILYGCPGEEGGAAKAFMARDGLWRSLDAALTWHPDPCNEVFTGSTNACIQTQYTFHGVASHASAAPEQGRSALDAVELMNVGVQFLREHMGVRSRVHYAVTDAGGRSPNVVQAKASVLYMVRSDKVREAIALQARVDDIAQGAALMTGTKCEKKFIDGLSEMLSNPVLERVLYDNFKALGVPQYGAEELDFADRLAATYGGANALPGIAAQYDAACAEEVAAQKAARPHAMNDFLMPFWQGAAFEAGSTDVGDVSYL